MRDHQQHTTWQITLIGIPYNKLTLNTNNGEEIKITERDSEPSAQLYLINNFGIFISAPYVQVSNTKRAGGLDFIS